MDIRDNPYRLKADSYRHSPSLLHATLALSFQHLAKQQNCKDMEEQTHHHRSAAIHGFSQALMDSRGPSLLDTLLTLVNLEVSPEPNLFFKYRNEHIEPAARSVSQLSALGMST